MSQSLTYDHQGHIQTKSDVGVYRYGEILAECARPAAPDQLTSVGNRRYCYDDAGNVLTDGRSVMTYWQDGKPETITTPHSSTRYHYASDGLEIKRVEVKGDEEEIVYSIDQNFEYRLDRSGSQWVIKPDGHVTLKIAGNERKETPLYHLQNHKGDPIAQLDAYGFGRFIHQDPWGLKEDESESIIHYGGRLYDPQVARFLSPDPLVQDSSND